MPTIFLVRLNNGRTVAVPATSKVQAYGIAVAGYPASMRPLSCGIEARSVRLGETLRDAFRRVQAEADLASMAAA